MKEKTDITPGGLIENPMLRIPSAFIIMSADNNENGKHFPGTVGFKYGSNKTDWLRISYTEMKRVIDFCRENRDLFNSQLEKERNSTIVSDL